MMIATKADFARALERLRGRDPESLAAFIVSLAQDSGPIGEQVRTVSVFVATFKQSSAVYFIRPGHTALTPRIGYSILSLLFGWWGIPWGPIYTVQAFWNNAIGGLDLTPEILSHKINASTG